MARSARFPAYIRYSTFPSAPLTGLSITPLHVEPDLARERDDGLDRGGALRFIAHDPALCRRRALPTSNCGLISATSSPRRNVATAGRISFSEMKETSMETNSMASSKSAAVEIARVDLLAIDDARIVAQRDVELPVADVDRVNLLRAVLQHHVGEAAGRRADVRADLPVDADPEFAQRMRELHPAAPDPGMLQLLDAQLVVIARRSLRPCRRAGR